MQEFMDVADGKMVAKLMTEQIFKSSDVSKKKPNNMRTPEVSNIEAKDNPPTSTKRSPGDGPP